MKRIILTAILILFASAAMAQESGCPAAVPPQIYAAYVKRAQLELNLNNFDAGRPDGVASPKTVEAVRAYQRSAGLAADGCITQSLVDHLQFVLPKTVKPRLSRAKPEVIEAQTLLTRRGYYLGTVDGIEGRMTRAALRRFQKDAGLPETGAIDESLIAEIKSADPTIRGDKRAP